MIAASAILYELAGSPPQKGCSDTGATCWLCGDTAVRGVKSRRWTGAKFTDQNRCRAPWSDTTCEACVWACSWVAPPGFTVPADAKRGPNLRLFTHLWSKDEYIYAKKNEKPTILEWLQKQHAAPWFAAIADTGKKHVLPWTPVNHSDTGARVMLDDTEITIGDWALVDSMVDLLTWGVTKGEVEAGVYSPRSWTTCPSEIRAHDGRWADLRHSPWHKLALWLAQRNEEEHDRRKSRRNEKPDSRHRDGIAGGVPTRGGKPTQTLGPDRGADQDGNSDERDGRAVVHSDVENAPLEGSSRQIDLF